MHDAEVSGSEQSEDEDCGSERANSQDETFLDNRSVLSSQQARYRAVSDSQFGRQQGPRSHVSHADEPKTKKARLMPRTLQVLFRLGLYCDYTQVFPWAQYIPRISHLVSPYGLHATLQEPHEVTAQEHPANPFFDAEGAVWFSDQDKQADFARRFASYSMSASRGQAEPLRTLARMQLLGASDETHSCHTMPVAEVIAAHNVVNQRDELDTQPCPDVCDEIVCKGDFVTDYKMRNCPLGGLPGLPSLDLFVFEEATSSLEVAQPILRLYKHWNYGASRPELLSSPIPAVESEVVEFYQTPHSNAKHARVSVSTSPRSRRLDARAVLEHVHPDIRRQLDAPAVLGCRMSPAVTKSTAVDCIEHRLFTAQLLVVPNRVRDCHGKMRFVVCSVLRIRSTVPGCDPVLALRALEGAQGFQADLVFVVQRMVRLLEMPHDVSTATLFGSSGEADHANLACIGHEANLPLAFFNFLRSQGMSAPVPSPFAADWMGQRIDVYDADEVALYKEYLRVVYFSRNRYYAYVMMHTLQDLKDRSNAKLELSTTSVDWRLFFPGHHFRAVPKAVLQAAMAPAPASADERAHFDAFVAAQPDATCVFFGADRAPHTRGYVCMTAPVMRPEDGPEARKLQQHKAFKDGPSADEELQCVNYCSKRFAMYSAFAVSLRDPYEIFLERETPYPTEASMRENLGALSSIEREYFAHLTTPHENHSSLQREAMKKRIVESAYGSRDNPVRHELAGLLTSTFAHALLRHTRDVIAAALHKLLHFSVNTPIPQLRHAARFVLDLRLLDDAPPRASSRDNMAQQHLRVHDRVARGVPNDDAQASLRELQQFASFNSELNSVNYAVLRWLTLSHVSVWSSTVDGCYGYCIQVCDMGSSVRVRVPSAKRPGDFDLRDWDKKTPGSGVDTVWSMFGEYVNGFPKFLAPTDALRTFFSGNNFCELYQHKSLMGLKRLQGVVTNANDCVMEGMSEHASNLGVVGAMNELNKLEQTEEKIKAIFSNLGEGLGQSGATSRGVKEKPFSTTLSGVVVNIETLNPLQILCLASNLISEHRPASVNEGSRVVMVTSGCDDKYGRIATAQTLRRAPQCPPRPFDLTNYNGGRSSKQDVRKVDDVCVRRNMSLFLMEYLARVFALVHRGLCLHRHTRAGFGMLLWMDTRNSVELLTKNLRKSVYHDEDPMQRNLGGSLETAIYGKWVRSVLQTCLHRRLMQTQQLAVDEQRTQLQHVVLDALTTYMLVPVATAVVLSAMQLYLALIVLDVGVMLASCLALHYLSLPCHCPLHVLALVARGHLEDLSDAERKQYFSFASFLHSKLNQSVVPCGCMHDAFSPNELAATLTGCSPRAATDARAASPPSVYLCDKFFADKSQAGAPRAPCQPAEKMAAVFAAAQADADARLFWTAAGQGTRIPVPEGNAGGRNYIRFDALNVCPFFYSSIREKLCTDGSASALGVVMSFLRLCALDSGKSRYDLVACLLQPLADEIGAPVADMLPGLHCGSAVAEAWAAPILSDKTCVQGQMLDWAVSSEGVGLALDVLWFILSQALYASEWHQTDSERVSVVHTRNMSGAAQALVGLYLHVHTPKAAVPACVDGGVVLSEPSQDPACGGAAIVIPYKPRLHVDSGGDGCSFLHKYIREPREMAVVQTDDGPLLLSTHLEFHDRDSSALGEDVLARGDICPFPPESVAHLLSLMPSLMRVFALMHRQYPALAGETGCYWPVAVRLFGSSADAQTLAFPVALTQHALDEEIPCVSYRHGFCFVLTLRAGYVHLTPVQVDCTLTHSVADEAFQTHNAFKPLPLTGETLRFPAEQLSHAMAGGLVLRPTGAAYEKPGLLRGLVQPDGEAIPFAFLPIVRFQCLLLLQQLDGGWDAYSSTRPEPLTIGVLHTHPDTTTFLLHGNYHVRFFDAEEREFCVNFIFASQCLLRDGLSVFYTFTAVQFEQFVDAVCNIDAAAPNRHVDLTRRFRTCEPGAFALHCHYCLSDAPRVSLADTHIRIAFSVGTARGKRLDLLYADVPLFDDDNMSRMHLGAPPGPSVQHFDW